MRADKRQMAYGDGFTVHSDEEGMEGVDLDDKDKAPVQVDAQTDLRATIMAELAEAPKNGNIILLGCTLASTVTGGVLTGVLWYSTWWSVALGSIGGAFVGGALVGPATFYCVGTLHRQGFFANRPSDEEQGEEKQYLGVRPA